MNDRLLDENWDRLRPMLRAEWGRLTDEDLDTIEEQIDGRKDELIARIQERHLQSRDHVVKALEKLLDWFEPEPAEANVATFPRTSVAASR